MEVMTESSSNEGIKDIEKAKLKLNGDMNGTIEGMDVDHDSVSHDNEDDGSNYETEEDDDDNEGKVNNGHENSDSDRTHSEHNKENEKYDDDEDQLMNTDEENDKNDGKPSGGDVSVSGGSSKPNSVKEDEDENDIETEEEGDVNKPDEDETKEDSAKGELHEREGEEDEDNGDEEKVNDEQDEKTPKKKKTEPTILTPRRSSRTVQKPVRFGQEVTNDTDEEEDVFQGRGGNLSGISITAVRGGVSNSGGGGIDDDSDEIEEITPQDPLADPLLDLKKIPRRIGSTTIVVNDTKRLAEIAARNTNSQKKEPTLVIIDTNSILSGRGAVPMSSHGVTATVQPPPPLKPAYPGLPSALPAQGLYPAKPVPKIPPILPTLTDDMYVVEAPSFIVPYVYEKPPVKHFKKYLRKFLKQIKCDRIKQEEEDELEEKREEEEAERRAKEENKTVVKMEVEENKDDKEENKEVGDDPSLKMDFEEEQDKEIEKIKEKEGDEEKEKLEKVEEKEVSEEKKDEEVTEKQDSDKVKGECEKNVSIELVKKEITSDDKKQSEKEEVSSSDDETDEDEDKKKPLGTTSYFDNPLGKFFMQIGMNLVQEFVQTDLLKQQKKKQKSGKATEDTEAAIATLKRNLQVSKENNEPYNMEQNKCDYCSFKTESKLIMAHHLETPHMRNYVYRCNFCPLEVRGPHDILFHMEAEHNIRGRLERAPAFHQCPQCPFEDNQKGKLTRHLLTCAKKFRPEKNLEPPLDWEPPAKIPRLTRKPPSMPMNANNPLYQQALAAKNMQHPLLPKMVSAMSNPQNPLFRARPRVPTFPPGVSVNPANKVIPARPATLTPQLQRGGMLYRASPAGSQVIVPTSYQITGNQLFQKNPAAVKLLNQPSISITPLPRQGSTNSTSVTANTQIKPGGSGSKTTFVICEICDGYIKDLEQLRNHMQWIHKVKIHPKMIYNRPPLNCQKCQFRFFTDQGLERHLLGSHGLVTSSMQDSANKGKDGGRCPVCGRVYQWKLLNHVARDHNMTLKPAHLSYKCTVCTATFGMYKQFENHVYSAHSVVAKRVMDNKKNGSTPSVSSNRPDTASLLKPLKINDEITIIPQPAKKPNVPAARPLPGTSRATIVPKVTKPSNDSVQVIDLDDSPQKHASSAGENGSDSLNAVKERLRRRKSLEIRQVESEEQDRSEEEEEEEETEEDDDNDEQQEQPDAKRPKIDMTPSSGGGGGVSVTNAGAAAEDQDDDEDDEDDGGETEEDEKGDEESEG